MKITIFVLRKTVVFVVRNFCGTYSLKRLSLIVVIVLDILLVYLKFFNASIIENTVFSVLIALSPIVYILILILGIYLLCRKTPKAQPNKKVDLSRRHFLSFSATLVHDESVHAINNSVGKGVSSFTGKRNPKSKTPVFPPGGRSYAEFRTKCNSCMSCIEVCPSKILEPGIKFGQGLIPHISFRNGWCEPNCLKCSEICPTGALKIDSAEEKKEIIIGHAVWIKENCLSTEEKECRICEKACPQKCIEWIKNGRHQYPIVNTYNCTGCGACEYMCPAVPLKGIYVEAYSEHRNRN